jgi:hypothetical protein
MLRVMGSPRAEVRGIADLAVAAHRRNARPAFRGDRFGAPRQTDDLGRRRAENSASSTGPNDLRFAFLRTDFSAAGAQLQAWRRTVGSVPICGLHRFGAATVINGEKHSTP